MPESSPRILKVIPQAAISGGLLEVVLDNFELLPGEYCHCLVNSRKVTPVAVSKNRCLLRLPRTEDSTAVLQLESSGKALTNTVIFKTGVCLAEGMHLVSNPCIDPVDGSIILTKSGSRGQEIPVTLFRLAKDGELSEISVDIMNPTGLAFDEKGTLYVSSRA
ncbi:MAG TPA: hypothetical protein VNK26_08655, partial [Pyrinomonadaceae bacterium]|nr:hypothetical protein [Pyrinomonadaceae bacterium]